MIKVTARGLDGFRQELEVAEGRLVEGVHQLGSDLADQTAKGARIKAERGKLTGASQDSIRSQGPVVTAGAGVPWYGFADFGGKVGEGRRIHRPYIKGGRWLFPAVRELDVGKQAGKVVDEATKGLR